MSERCLQGREADSASTTVKSIKVTEKIFCIRENFFFSVLLSYYQHLTYSFKAFSQSFGETFYSSSFMIAYKMVLMKVFLHDQKYYLEF